MAVCCPVCRCDFTQSLGDLYQCLGCSAHFDPADGSVHDTDTAETVIAPAPVETPAPTDAPTPVEAPVEPAPAEAAPAEAAPESPPAILPDPDPSAQ